VFADRRGQLHAPLRLRLLVPARVAGPIAESHARARARQRRGLAPAPEARGGGAGATGGDWEGGRRGCVGIRAEPPGARAGGGAGVWWSAGWP
jgi:hypothetical protein